MEGHKGEIQAKLEVEREVKQESISVSDSIPSSRIFPIGLIGRTLQKESEAINVKQEVQQIRPKKLKVKEVILIESSDDESDSQSAHGILINMKQARADRTEAFNEIEMIRNSELNSIYNRIVGRKDIAFKAVLRKTK